MGKEYPICRGEYNLFHAWFLYDQLIPNIGLKGMFISSPMVKFAY